MVDVERASWTRAAAFVILHPGERLDSPAIKGHVAALLARYKVPEFVFAVDEFPVSEGGNGAKVQKQALRVLAAELASSALPGVKA